jgi:hypothetical protein
VRRRVELFIFVFLLPHVLLDPIVLVIGFMLDDYLLLVYGLSSVALSYAAWMRMGGWKAFRASLREAWNWALRPVNGEEP